MAALRQRCQPARPLVGDGRCLGHGSWSPIERRATLGDGRSLTHSGGRDGRSGLRQRGKPPATWATGRGHVVERLSGQGRAVAGAAVEHQAVTPAELGGGSGLRDPPGTQGSRGGRGRRRRSCRPWPTPRPRARRRAPCPAGQGAPAPPRPTVSPPPGWPAPPGLRAGHGHLRHSPHAAPSRASAGSSGCGGRSPRARAGARRGCLLQGMQDELRHR